MDLVKLESQIANGMPVSAVFCKEKGMNLMSLKFGPYELMEQTTKILFDQRGAGLGALIGPHFHHRRDKDIIVPKDPYLFPHFELLREQNVKEPFSHGIARYVPWEIKKFDKNGVEAFLSSKMQWKQVSYGELEGMDFEMTFKAFFNATGLMIDYSIISQKPSVIGFHYYYALSKDGKNIVQAKVKDEYVDTGEVKKIPSTFGYNTETHEMNFDLVNPSDYNFKPFPIKNFKPTMASVKLKRPDYNMQVNYTCATDENSWQLYHPKGALFGCIEPLSAQDPRKPKLNYSGLTLHISLV